MFPEGLPAVPEFFPGLFSQTAGQTGAARGVEA